jgi:hypothetical protein
MRSPLADRVIVPDGAVAPSDDPLIADAIAAVGHSDVVASTRAAFCDGPRSVGCTGLPPVPVLTITAA